MVSMMTSYPICNRLDQRSLCQNDFDFCLTRHPLDGISLHHHHHRDHDHDHHHPSLSDDGQPRRGKERERWSRLYSGPRPMRSETK